MLNGVRGSLNVQWYTPPDAQAAPEVDNGAANWLGHSRDAKPFVPGVEFVAKPQSGDAGGERYIRKYTCRFEIGIENDRDFHVARRIIGQKGTNMKRIVKLTDAKLRLRGRGSGFLEGNSKQESSEPLHLCISCKDADGYKIAIAETEVLLEQVYEEYRSYCLDMGLAQPDDLCVSIREHPIMGGGREPRESGGYGRFEGTQFEPWSGGEFHPNGDSFAYGSQVDLPAGAPTIDEIERLIEERNEARRMCNFREADRIRDLLRANGIGLMDEPGGRGRGAEVTTWRFWRQ